MYPCGSSVLLGCLRLEILRQWDVFHGPIILYSLNTLHVMACLGDPPHCQVPGRRIIVVQAHWLQVCLERSGGLVCSVERHLMEQVVGYVGGPDLVMEEVKYAIWTVNGGEGTSHPCPLISTIVWYGWIIVLKPCVEHKPRIGEHVGSAVPEEDSEESMIHGDFEQKGAG